MTVPTQISAPSTPLPGLGTVQGPPAPAYVDGIPVTLATPPVTPRGRQDRQLRFWSSQPRMPSANLQENYYVSTGNPVQINYISFDLAHFPHQAAIYWMDDDGNWNPVTWSNGTPVSVVINGSVPAVVNNKAALAAGLNPYHYGAGHWVHFDEIISVISTSQLLFVMNRSFATTLPAGVTPVDASGNVCAYPLGIRDLDFGYLIQQRSDVPWTPRNPSVITERMPFDTCDDVHGSPMTVAIRENRASDMVAGASWRCQPQLRSDAVVCLYIDSRDPTGNPQVIDRFYMDPVTSGVRVNLYYAAQPPPSGAVFGPLDAPLLSPDIQAGGTQLPAALQAGLSFPDTSTFLTISAAAAGITGSAPWWVGIAFQPQFASSDPDNYLIVDAEIFQLYFSGGSFIATSQAGNVFGQWTVPFAVSDTIIFAVVFDGSNLWGWVSATPSALSAAALGIGSAPLNSNPYFSSGSVAGWTASEGSSSLTLAPPVAPDPSILSAFAAEFVSSGPAGTFSDSPLPFTAASGQPYLASVWLLSVGATTVQAGFGWQTSSGVQNGLQEFTLPGGVWTLCATVQVAPQGTTGGWLQAVTSASGQTIWIMNFTALPAPAEWGLLHAAPAFSFPTVKAISLGGALPSTGIVPLISNPDFGGGSTAGWSGFNAAITALNSAPPGGPQAWSILLQPSGAEPYCALEGEPASFTVIPGAQYTVTAAVSPLSSSVPVEIGFDWQNASHLYETTTTQIISPVLGQWSAYTFTFTAPQAAVYGYPRVGLNNENLNDIPTSAQLWIQQVQVTGPGTFAQMNGNYLLNAMVIKQETLDMTQGIPADLVSFADNPGGYVYPPGGSVPGDTTQNSAVRFHPSFILGTVNPYGFVGGIGSAYESCSWTPVMADYTLSKGFMEFDPVLASVFKFEFTSLAPEPFDWIGPVTVPMKTMTSKPPSLSGASSVPLDNGLTVNQQVAPSANFADSPFPQQPYPPGSSLPREALYATTPAGAEIMASKNGSLYNFQQWKPSSSVPVNIAAGPHGYGSADFPTHSRIAYFVAINSLTMYRTSYTSQDDTEEYTDYFGDLANVGPQPFMQPLAVPWNWSPGFLTTPGGLSSCALMQSKIFPSDHTVTGVQFATTQSDAVQILADPDFASPGIPEWKSVGDALPVTIAANINTQLGAMAQITRNATGEVTSITGVEEVPSGVLYEWQDLMNNFSSWSLLMTAIGDWAGFLHIVYTPEQYTIAIPAASYYGGISTVNPQAVTGAGRIYAAARVFSPVALSQPLALQILDGATGTVLAEEENPVAGGVVTEWYVGYTLGSADFTTALTWSQMIAQYPAWNDFFNPVNGDPEAWLQIDTSVTPLGQTVNVQLIQRGITADTWYVDNVSLFEQSIVWQFSNDGGNTFYPALDIRNNPSGVLIFPPLPQVESPLVLLPGQPPLSPAQQGTGNQLVWQLQGWRPGLCVSSLVIRPWYSVYPRGVPPQAAGIGYGPNLTPGDYYPPIASDPHWQAWDSPIPQSWYFAYQALLNESSNYVPVIEAPGEPGGLVLGDALVVSEASQLPPPPPEAPFWDDILVDVFTDTFGIGGAGDIYDDNYDNVYESDYIITTGTVWDGISALTAASQLAASATTVPGSQTVAILGAALGTVGGVGIPVTSFIASTGEALNLRRIYLGNQIPASLGASLVAYDAGVRKVFIDFQPDATTTTTQLDEFLASCQAGGLNAAVSLWSNPQLSFNNPQDYFTIVQEYSPIIRQHGYDHVFVISNTEAVYQGGLSRWFPGEEWVDAISAGFFCEGPMPGDGGTQTLSAMAAFARQQALPFGLAEFGADWSLYSEAEGVMFLEYILRFLKAQIASGNAIYDCVYLSASTFNLTDAPAAWAGLYDQISALLAGSYGASAPAG
jgi:hypothetical protein